MVYARGDITAGTVEDDNLGSKKERKKRGSGLGHGRRNGLRLANPAPAGFAILGSPPSFPRSLFRQFCRDRSGSVWAGADANVGIVMYVFTAWWYSCGSEFRHPSACPKTNVSYRCDAQ